MFGGVPINIFPNFEAPDLGCFIRQKHGRQIETLHGNIHVELNPSIDFHPQNHQLYFRVICGDATFFERCLVYMQTDLSRPPLESDTPDYILGGEFRPQASDWLKFPTQTQSRYYWFYGQLRNPSGGTWTADATVAHSYDIYQNGTLSTIYFDDAGGDQDLNDFILEAAIVGRVPNIIVQQASNQGEVNKRVNSNVLDDLESLIYKPDTAN